MSVSSLQDYIHKDYSIPQQLPDCDYDSSASQTHNWPLVLQPLEQHGHDTGGYAFDGVTNFDGVDGVDTGPQSFDDVHYFAHPPPMVIAVQPTQINSCVPYYVQQQYYPEEPQQAHDDVYISGQQAVEHFNGNDTYWEGPAELEETARELRNCPELRENRDLPRHLLLAFLQTIHLPPRNRGKGSRKGARCYICRWENCGKRVVRRDHAMAHVASHVGSKPFQCEYCPRAFLRRADRKRHSKSCRPNRRQTSEFSVVSSGTSHGGSVDTTTQSSGHTSQFEVWDASRVMAVFFGLFCMRCPMSWTLTGSMLRFLQSTLRAQSMNAPFLLMK